MTDRERKARALCAHHKVDPDQKGIGMGLFEEQGTTYLLWEYWARHYVDVLESTE